MDSANPYGHFGLGMQESEEGGLLPAANASLKFYLDSNADRGPSPGELERRNLAGQTYKTVHARFLESRGAVPGGSVSSYQWRTYPSTAGYEIELPSTTVFEQLGQGRFQCTIGEIVVFIGVFPAVAEDGYHSLTSEQLQQRNGPTKAIGAPTNVKVGALQGLRSSGEFRDKTWGTLITAIAPAPKNVRSVDAGRMGADIAYLLRAAVPLESKESAKPIIDRIVASFAITRPLTAERYYSSHWGN